MTIDYAEMNREMPKLKSALTRAQKSGDIVKVLDAVEKALDTFDRVGAYPDNWNIWRNALDDAWQTFRRSDAYDDDHFDNDAVIATRYEKLAWRFA
jgi:hypothetical protein